MPLCVCGGCRQSFSAGVRRLTFDGISCNDRPKREKAFLVFSCTKKDWRGNFNRNATSAIQIEKKKEIIFKNKLPLAILYLDIWWPAKKKSLRRNLHGNCRSTTVNLSSFLLWVIIIILKEEKNVRFWKNTRGTSLDWISIYRCVCRVDSHTHTCSAAPYRWHTWRRTRYAFLMVAASRQMFFIVRNDPNTQYLWVLYHLNKWIIGYKVHDLDLK